MLLNRRVYKCFIPKIKQNFCAVTSKCRLSTSSEKYKDPEGKLLERYDVIIAGGGMVGSTLACAMGKYSLLSDLKVLLLEGGPDKKFELKPEYSNRVVALNQQTRQLMSSIDVWKHVEQMRVQPVQHMQIWDACSDALITFSNADNLDDDVAYIVENDVLLHAINRELKSNVKNVDIVYGAKIAGYELNNSKTKNNKVIMPNGDYYECPLLIGADGANSAVRQTIGCQYLCWNYNQMGVVATLHLAEETQNTTAWQRFLPTGPVALLPLNSKHSSLVWSTSQDQAKWLLQLPDEQFVDCLNDALWKQYPRSASVDSCMSWVSSLLRGAGLPDSAQRQLPPSIRSIALNSRAAFPLGFGHSTRYVAQGVALVGDAAHRVHPLAGQGVNLGFGDIKDLTEFLADAMYSGLEITHESWLTKYESSRQFHNVPTQLMVDALHRLYTLDLAPLVLLRSVGLQVTNAIHPIKKMIMSHAAT